jgi:hypothetical protein
MAESLAPRRTADELPALAAYGGNPIHRVICLSLTVASTGVLRQRARVLSLVAEEYCRRPTTITCRMLVDAFVAVCRPQVRKRTRRGSTSVTPGRLFVHWWWANGEFSASMRLAVVALQDLRVWPRGLCGGRPVYCGGCMPAATSCSSSVATSCNFPTSSVNSVLALEAPMNRAPSSMTILSW